MHVILTVKYLKEMLLEVKKYYYIPYNLFRELVFSVLLQ